MPLRLVVYDLDGTLVDSRGDLASSVNDMLGALGLPRRPDAEIWGFVGEGAEQLVRRSLGAEHEGRLAEAMTAWREAYARRLLETTRPYPGVEELLRAPPPLRAVLTNKPGGFARRILEGLGLAGAFARVVGGDEMVRKPDPRGLLDLCAALGVAPEDAVLVGDSLVDAETARAAGVPFWAVTWGLGARQALEAAAPALIAATAADLLAALRHSPS